MNAALTHHAEVRADERIGWSPEILGKMAARALERGREPGAFSGRFRRYLDGKAMAHHTRLRVYGQHLYCFGTTGSGADVLVTVYPLPSEFHKYL